MQAAKLKWKNEYEKHIFTVLSGDVTAGILCASERALQMGELVRGGNRQEGAAQRRGVNNSTCTCNQARHGAAGDNPGK